MADGSSRFAFSGSEELGAGLKANFQIETRFRSDDNGGGAAFSGDPTTPASQLATGNTFVGLSGGFGALQMGKMDTHYCLGSDSHGSRATALQASSCGLLGYVNGSGAAAAIAGTTRSVNVIRYTTPSFGGLTLQANYSPNFSGSEGAVGDAGKGDAMGLSATYANGPLKAGISLWNAESENQLITVARSEQKAGTVMVSYDFGVANVGLTFDESAIESAVANSGTFSEDKRRVWSLPITAPVGPGTAILTYSKADNVKRNGSELANTGATLWSVGYDYPFSKRTSLGVSYARLNNESAAAYGLYTQSSLNGTPQPASSNTGTDVSQFYIGVRHAF